MDSRTSCGTSSPLNLAKSSGRAARSDTASAIVCIRCIWRGPVDRSFFIEIENVFLSCDCSSNTSLLLFSRTSDIIMVLRGVLWSRDAQRQHQRTPQPERHRNRLWPDGLSKRDARTQAAGRPERFLENYSQSVFVVYTEENLWRGRVAVRDAKPETVALLPWSAGSGRRTGVSSLLTRTRVVPVCMRTHRRTRRDAPRGDNRQRRLPPRGCSLRAAHSDAVAACGAAHSHTRSIPRGRAANNTRARATWTRTRAGPTCSVAVAVLYWRLPQHQYSSLSRRSA